MTTIKDWRRKRKELESFSMTVDDDQSARKTLKKPKLEILDDAVWIWFNQERRKGTPLSGPIIQEKAIALHSKISGQSSTVDTFTASEGWLQRWKNRHGVRQFSISGEKLSSDLSGAQVFIGKFKQLAIENNLLPDQVYNIDETGLNYKMLPNKTLASKKEIISGHKPSKERLTIALCSNASGDHKLPLFVIGKSKKPRAFKYLNMNALPVYYRSQKSAWMDCHLFKEWFDHEFAPAVRQFLKSKNLPQKAILLMDNAPSHPGENILSSGEIKALFLPPNVTPLIQPMDQGVIECLKKKYRRKFVGSIVEQEDSDLIQAIKKLNIKDFIYTVASAWNEISPGTLKKSWRKVWPTMDNCETEDNVEDNAVTLEIVEDLQTINPTIETSDVEEWLANVDENDHDCEELNDEEIISAASKTSEENEEEPSENPKITHATAKEAFEVALKYVEEHEESTANDILMLKRWRDKSARARESGLRQKQITEFFKN